MCLLCRHAVSPGIIGNPAISLFGAIRGPARSQNPCENRRENRPKIAPGRGPGDPKSRQNRVRDPLGTLRGAQERPEGVSEASQQRLRASPACPGSARRLPKGGPGHHKERPGRSGSAPRRPKSTPSRLRERKYLVFFAQHGREGLSE